MTKVALMTVPEMWDEIAEPAGISNMDFSVDPGVEDQLRAGGMWTRYAGANFNGIVWFADKRFFCEVWRYGEHVTTVSEDSLEDLMHAVSEEFGYD